jgi:hypothetical protein
LDRVTFPTIGRDRFTAGFLDDLRNEGDPPADAAVTEFFDGQDRPADELFSALVRATKAPVDDEHAAGIGAFVTAEEAWPDWVDPDLVRQGQQVFGDFGPQLGLGLWMASLPADYAGADGALPLLFTTRLTRSPRRRYLETGQMLVNVMTPGGLDPGGVGYETVRHVRLMHAAVRHALLHVSDIDTASDADLPPWDPKLGIPVNQGDLLGALFAFSIVGVRCLERSGVRLTDADAEAYIHTWNLVGHQLGIRDDLLPLDRADAEAVFATICTREYRSSAAGRELTAAAIECMQELLVSKRLRGLPATGIRHYLGNDVADLLGVPPADWTRSFFAFERRSDGIFARTLSRIPGTRQMTARLGRRMFESFIEAERGGDRATFEITDELRQAWGIGASTTS